MKKRFFQAIIFCLAVTSLMGDGFAANNKTQPSTHSGQKVELFYFHFSRRCVTCNAVENETKAALEALYGSEIKKGQITFKSVNIDEKANEALVKRCRIEGQALLVISGNKRIDLTDKGFMYAKNNPEKLKAELKKAIDALL